MRDFTGKPKCAICATALYHRGMRLTPGPGRGGFSQ